MITAEKVRIICGRCQITIPGHLRVWLGVRACHSASAQSPTAPFWKSNVLGELHKSVLVEMADKSLRIKLVIVSLLEYNLNQQTSHFLLATLHAKFALTKILVHLCLNLTQPYQTRGDRNHFYIPVPKKLTPAPALAPELIGNLYTNSCSHSESLKAESIFPHELK